MNYLKGRDGNMRYSKWIVAAVITLNAAFAGAVLYVFLRVGSEPSALVGAWFAFTTGELWALATIKKKEIHNEGRNESGEN